MNLDLIITLYYYFGVSRSLRLLKVASLVSAAVNHLACENIRLAKSEEKRMFSQAINHCTRRIYFVIRARLHAYGRMCVCFRE